MFWELHQQSKIREAREQAARAESKAHAAAQAVERLHAAERQIDRALLIQTALLELVRERLGLSEEQVLAKIEEVDLRDGKRDGRMLSPPKPCPQCARRNHAMRIACLYCGEPLTLAGA